IIGIDRDRGARGSGEIRAKPMVTEAFILRSDPSLQGCGRESARFRDAFSVDHEMTRRQRKAEGAKARARAPTSRYRSDEGGVLAPSQQRGRYSLRLFAAGANAGPLTAGE